MADSEAKITLSAEDKASPVVQQAAQNFKDFQGTLVDINQYVGESSRGMADMAAASEGAIGSIASLTAELKQLTDEFNVLDPESEAFAQHAQDIQAVSGRLSELQGAASGATQGMSSFWQTALAAATGFTAANALQTVVTGMKDTAEQAVLSADAMNAMHNRASVIFGSDYPQMVQQSEALGASFGRSATEMLGFETQMTAVGKGLGMTQQAAEGMGTQMASLAVDLGKVFQESDDQALLRVQSAMLGNARALGQLGIAMKPAILDQFLMQQGSKDTMSQLDAESQAQVRLQYLMTQAHTIHEIAVKDTGNLDDELKVLGGTWDDLLRTMGTPIVPVVAATFGAISTIIKDTEGEVVALTDDVNNFLSLFTRTASTGDAFGLQSAFDKMKALKDGGSQGLGTINMNDPGLDLSLGKTTDSLDKGTKSAADWLDQLNQTPKAAAAGGKAVDALKQSLDALDTKYQDATQNIQNKLNDLDNTHQTKMQSMEDKMQTLGDAAGQLRSTYEEQIQGVQDKLGSLKDAFADTMDGITGKLEDAVGKQEDKIDSLKQKLSDLQLRAAQENRQGSTSLQTNTDIARTQADLDKETAALTAFKASGQLTPDQQKAADAYAGQTDFERQVGTIAAEKDKATATYNTNVSKETQTEVQDRASYLDKAGKNQTEQQALKDKMALEQTAYGLERDQMVTTQQALLTFSAAHGSAMQGMVKVTKDSVADMVGELKKLATAFNAATFQIQAKNLIGQQAAAGITRSIQLQQQGVQ